MAIIPATTDLGELSSLSVSTATKTVLDAKYADAMAWATWAATMLNDNVMSMTSKLSNDAVLDDLTALRDILNAIQMLTPPSSVFQYNAPVSPTYNETPDYVAPSLGTILAIPDVTAVSVGDVPSTVINFSNPDFTDTLLTAMRTKLANDLVTSNTGLGDAEAAMFARETGRIIAERAVAYNELTTQFSAAGWPAPPGALTAKQTELTNESSKRLADSSAAILTESARLAADYNKHIQTVAVQLIDILARAFDSKVLRDFDAAKTTVMLTLEGFKETIQVAIAKAELNKTAITATVAANDGTVKAFLGEIEGQIAPIKAISEINQTKATAFSAAVQAASADLQAQIIPEEFKVRVAEANAKIGGIKADAAAKEAELAIVDTQRRVTLEVETLRGLAQSAAQMVASALNSVNVSSSLGFQGSTSSSSSTSESVQHIFEGV